MVSSIDAESTIRRKTDLPDRLYFLAAQLHAFASEQLVNGSRLSRPVSAASFASLSKLSGWAEHLRVHFGQGRLSKSTTVPKECPTRNFTKLQKSMHENREEKGAAKGSTDLPTGPVETPKLLLGCVNLKK